MNNRSCFFKLPIKISLKEIHPDLLAMASLLCVYPFVAEELVLPFSVSSEFSDIVKKQLDINIPKKDSKIVPRKISNGRPGLAYSGGVDSTAALSLMPENTVVMFLDRIMPSFKKHLYDKTAPLSALGDLQSIKEEVYSVPTNLEYLRSPVGFPVDNDEQFIALAVYIPFILLADYYKIDSLASGAVMESVFKVGLEKFENFGENIFYNRWFLIFENISCELFFPTAGLTEVATAIIDLKNPVSNFTRSCMRGNDKKPCGKCVKCFRKHTLASALSGNKISQDELLDNINSREVLSHIYRYDISRHENVYRFIVDNIVDDDFFVHFGNRIRNENEDTSWMTRWYSKSIEFIPQKYREDYKTRLFLYIEPMNEKDIDFVEKWERDKYKKSEKIIKNWQKYLDTLIKDEKLLSYAHALDVVQTNKESLFKKIKKFF
ncbi:hypothetical protein B6S12_08755 [Helicobacter valdiviensis]|uniref:Uncharacterized protein n=1 Tax=Helicobacter valdiviensis TaxID=1458358 RepID=A0A2W6MSF0_9HELI|nr:DUF6395 domain-containing protein [Helicobacter valdiviensis]PZT47474.1 hypothetical protein B6S12_08755 [Helicobacter valdiviensis]